MDKSFLSGLTEGVMSLGEKFRQAVEKAPLKFAETLLTVCLSDYQ